MIDEADAEHRTDYDMSARNGDSAHIEATSTTAAAERSAEKPEAGCISVRLWPTV